MRYLCVRLLVGYRYWVSPMFGSACRFEPTCSEYASVAINRYGVLRGFGLAICRLLRCHPFHPGGNDPVK